MSLMTTPDSVVKFTTERPIADQLLESILENPNKWDIIAGSGSIKLRHKCSEIILCVSRRGTTQGSLRTSLQFRSPVTGWASYTDATIESLQFSDEENYRIYKAAMALKEARELEKIKTAEQALVDLLNQSRTVHKRKIGKIVLLPCFLSFAITLLYLWVS